MTKIIDTFLFTHEFDLLELRLRLLWDHVDKFIMMEGDHNFANKPKEMRFHEQAARFEWARSKLTTIHKTGKYKDYEGVIDVPGELYVEHQHRQYFYDTVKSMPFDKDDILMISDVDEIPSIEVIQKLKSESFVSPTLLHQEFYYYNVNGFRGKKWWGTIASRFGSDLGDIGTLRGKRNSMAFIDKDCGWHLAHFYDSDGIKEKLKHSSHQAYNDPVYYDPEHLKKCVKENKSYINKPDGDLKPAPIPNYLMDELKRFPLMMGWEWR